MTIERPLNNRGDMSAFAENFPHEDFFMQQARKNGAEVGAPDPTVGVGGLINFVVGLISAKSIVEIGTGSGVGALWVLEGMLPSGTLTSIDGDIGITGIAGSGASGSNHGIAIRDGLAITTAK